MFEESYHEGVLQVGPDYLGFYYDEYMKNPVYSIGLRQGCKEHDVSFTLYLGNTSTRVIKDIVIHTGDKIKIETYPDYLLPNTSKPLNITMHTKGTLLSTKSNAFDLSVSSKME
jgi:hypothetical protein